MRKEGVALFALITLAVAAEWDRLTGPVWIGMDTATAFLPWYTFLGDQLRAGHIPTWNPYAFSGAPFAADPESGWMYLPAMLFFRWLPADAALRAHLLFHVLLAALSTYALTRSLGLNRFGGLLASTVYAHSGFFEGHNVCCYAYADVAAWLPLCLLGVELAIRSASWRGRILSWGLAGFAMSQILAAWIGQGSYYAALVVGAYIASRTLFGTATVRPTLGVALRSVAPRLVACAVHSLGTATFSFALAAAGLLPRLEYNLVSNLRGGYPSADVSLRAMSWNDWGFIGNWGGLLLQPGFEYVGWPVLLLALAAIPLCLRKGFGFLSFFVALAFVVLVLARAQPTPLHALFSFLPGFENIHARSPERALIVLYLAPAVLAGATLSWVTSRRRLQIFGPVVGCAAIAFIAFDLHAAWAIQSAESLAGRGDYQFARVNLAAFLAPTAAAQFLTNAAATQPPFRYFGYAGHVFGGPMPYTLRWQDPTISALQVNNRGLLTGLSDIQGYNPVHVAPYDDFIAAANGHSQNYHHADIFDTGLDSDLLDLLNARYVVMPAVLASDEVAPNYARPLQSVYADDAVQILENPSALPRAWLVHAIEEVPPDASSATLLSRGVDLRNVAIVEAPGPPVAPPADVSREFANIDAYAPDGIQFHVQADAPALLIASEIAYPAWHAYLDGQSVPMLTADLALRAVAVPTGEHLVQMRFESAALQFGLIVSAAAAAVLVGMAILHSALTTFRSHDGSGEVRCKPGAVPQL